MTISLNDLQNKEFSSVAELNGQKIQEKRDLLASMKLFSFGKETQTIPKFLAEIDKIDNIDEKSAKIAECASILLNKIYPSESRDELRVQTTQHFCLFSHTFVEDDRIQLEKLLRLGANPNQWMFDGDLKLSALQVAVGKRKSLRDVAILLKYGANPDYKDEKNKIRTNARETLEQLRPSGLFSWFDQRFIHRVREAFRGCCKNPIG